MGKKSKGKATIWIWGLLIFMSLTAIIPQVGAAALPDKATILAKMVLANNYFLAKYPDPSANADATHEGNIWTKSTYLEGLMALYGANHDTALYNYAVNWATYFNWNARSGNRTTNADDQCCMQTYEELYVIDPIASRLTNTTTCMDNMCSLSAVNQWTWIDALHMSMPVLAKLGAITGDVKYANKMYQCWNYTKTTAGLYDTTKNLWWRDSSFKGGSIYWSRGNGWVFAALVRVLSVLPTTDVHYNEYVTVFKEMAAALKACQRTDGFWNPDLLNPNNYGSKETSGTAFFTYGLAWGINNGFLDSVTYLPCVQNGWNGMVNDALHTNGFLGWVQGTGSQPSDGQPLSYDKVPNFEDFALGGFLLAGSEVYKLAGGTLLTPTPTRRGASTVTPTKRGTATVTPTTARFTPTPTRRRSTLTPTPARSRLTPTVTRRGNAVTPTATPASRTNIALNKTAFADSYRNFNPASFGNDGNTTSLWAPSTTGGTSHWWKVDLGGVYDLTGSEVMWGQSGVYHYQVEISIDNVTWSLVVDKTNNTSAAQTQRDDFTATARYVRITFTTSGYVSTPGIYEFRVFN